MREVQGVGVVLVVSCHRCLLFIELDSEEKYEVKSDRN